MPKSKTSISFRYTFTFEDDSKETFDVNLNPDTLDLQAEPHDPYPTWTDLQYHQCPNCPLDPTTHPQCPIAANMAELSSFFSNVVSYNETDVEIVTEDRSYFKHTSIQQALASLMGIYMVTSGCPIMDKLRPMARSHLPFATLEETSYRVISMYLTAQFILYRKGHTPDWDLNHLTDLYNDIRIINQNYFKRLQAFANKDANTNALIILNTFADYISLTIDDSMLKELENFFSAYLPEEDPS